MISEKEVLKKGSAEEYIAFLRAVTPKLEKDSTIILKEMSKEHTLDEIFESKPEHSKPYQWIRYILKHAYLCRPGIV